MRACGCAATGATAQTRGRQALVAVPGRLSSSDSALAWRISDWLKQIALPHRKYLAKTLSLELTKCTGRAARRMRTR